MKGGFSINAYKLIRQSLAVGRWDRPIIFSLLFIFSICLFIPSQDACAGNPGSILSPTIKIKDIQYGNSEGGWAVPCQSSIPDDNEPSIDESVSVSSNQAYFCKQVFTSRFWLELLGVSGNKLSSHAKTTYKVTAD